MTLIEMQNVLLHALRTLDKQVVDLMTEFREQINCKRGCFGCCQDGFKIRYNEAQYLFEGFQAADSHTQESIRQNLNAENPTQCPILVDGACSLYQNRPVLCRAYGVIIQLKDDVATCGLNFQLPDTGKPLKSLDIAPYYDLMHSLSDQAWAQQPHPAFIEETTAPVLSIRDFFNRFLTIANAP